MTSEQIHEAEAKEDAQLTSAANDTAVPELTAPDSTGDAASAEAAQDAEPAPMDTAAAEAVPEAAEVPDQPDSLSSLPGINTHGELSARQSNWFCCMQQVAGEPASTESAASEPATSAGPKSETANGHASET